MSEPMLKDAGWAATPEKDFFLETRWRCRYEAREGDWLASLAHTRAYIGVQFAITREIQLNTQLKGPPFRPKARKGVNWTTPKRRIFGRRTRHGLYHELGVVCTNTPYRRARSGYRRPGRISLSVG